MLYIRRPKLDYELECDVCGNRSGILSHRQIMEIHIGAWELNIYDQGNGYQFLSMACSKACRDRWEESYLKGLNLKRQHTQYPIRLLIAHENRYVY